MSAQITVIHRDEAIVVVAKAPGVPSQPDSSADPSALSLAERHTGTTLWVVHRIDRPASGLVVFAASAAAAGRLSLEMREGRFERRYWAVVEGVVAQQEATVETGIAFDRAKNRSRVVTDGRRARLRYRVRARGERYSLVEVALETGRHHQIRAQLAHALRPIRGDVKYGARRTLPNGGIALHAMGVRFAHPANDETVTFTAPPPLDRLWEALVGAMDSSDPFSDW